MLCRTFIYGAHHVDEDFDMDILRASSVKVPCANQTEALTEIEYGNDADIDAIERAMNQYMKTT